MLSQLIWWSSIALETLLLFQGFRERLVWRYPVFYGYISFVLFQDFVRYLAYLCSPRLYHYAYWAAEFMGVIVGCWVVFEIYQVALSAYPGTARMARTVLLLLFLMAVTKEVVTAWNDSQWLAATTALQFERALRTVQAAAIIALVVSCLFYSIPFGKNLRGILLGYSLFIVERIVCLTFIPPQGHHFWFYAYSASYPVVLGVWIAHLWSYEPCPEPKATVHLEEDYRRIAAATRRRLQDARVSLRKAVRS